jgi:UDP-N-acetylmuramate: L-alanyl-gamma-D-glutamyl-meso-diaminopimelate ligase
MRVHFIAIGGAAMHNLALALNAKGYNITGSDDEIFEPSRSRLSKAGLLPKVFGWHSDCITPDIDAIILGMHAREDNPELLRAQELDLRIYSYPEFLYEQTKNKTRIVIGGSHGKTSITSMVMHVLKYLNYKFDYMVGAQINGFDTMVSLSDEADIAVFEGDEYLSSPIDRRPKFHLYKPHIALLSGIAWDHINVFPTFENYLEQFNIFIQKIKQNGSLIYLMEDEHISELVERSSRKDISMLAYQACESKINNGATSIFPESVGEVKLEVFGDHNLQNIAGACEVCKQTGISEKDFYGAISSFRGSAKRLQKIYSKNNKIVFLDFAHSPSKVKGTLDAVKKQFNSYEIIAVYELHTFSSLNKAFLQEYKGSLDQASEAIVYFNPEVVAHKRLPEISSNDVLEAFGANKLNVLTKTTVLRQKLNELSKNEQQVFLLMSSGNFGGLKPSDLVSIITE